MKPHTILITKKFLLLFVITALLVGCKHKKVSLSGNSKVDVTDFLESFDDIKLPYQVTDSVFNNDEPDSALISYKVFTQFIPDSVMRKMFGKSVLPHIYPVGKVKAGKNETYLFLKAATKAKEWLYVICFDNTDKFKTAKPLFSSAANDVNNIVSLDNKYILSIRREHKTNGELLFKKDTYVYNDGAFMMILTESNEVASKNKAVLNPVDTLQHKHKFSGDYYQDKLNFISVRDGKDASHIIIFVHFEKNNGDCKGELKGDAKIISPFVAQYSSSGDPCLVNFTFNDNKIVMKELEGCGNHRDIKCFFEGVYTKQKEVKKKPVKKHH